MAASMISGNKATPVKQSNYLIAHKSFYQCFPFPFFRSNTDIEAQNGTPVRNSTPFDMEVDSLNASRGHNTSKPRGTFYENPPVDQERLVSSL